MTASSTIRSPAGVISGAGDKGGDSQSGLVSGVARHPRKVSTLTSVPQATSAVAR